MASGLPEPLRAGSSTVQLRATGKGCVELTEAVWGPAVWQGGQDLASPAVFPAPPVEFPLDLPVG